MNEQRKLSYFDPKSHWLRGLSLLRSGSSANKKKLRNGSILIFSQLKL